jgi:hypothetical protein
MFFLYFSSFLDFTSVMSVSFLLSFFHDFIRSFLSPWLLGTNICVSKWNRVLFLCAILDWTQRRPLWHLYSGLSTEHPLHSKHATISPSALVRNADDLLCTWRRFRVFADRTQNLTATVKQLAHHLISFYFLIPFYWFFLCHLSSFLTFPCSSVPYVFIYSFPVFCFLLWAFLNLNSVNQLIFVTVRCGVLFEVRTEFLSTM